MYGTWMLSSVVLLHFQKTRFVLVVGIVYPHVDAIHDRRIRCQFGARPLFHPLQHRSAGGVLFCVRHVVRHAEHAPLLAGAANTLWSVFRKFLPFYFQ